MSSTSPPGDRVDTADDEFQDEYEEQLRAEMIRAGILDAE